MGCFGSRQLKFGQKQNHIEIMPTMTKDKEQQINKNVNKNNKMITRNNTGV
jgi:hypothetical protein